MNPLQSLHALGQSVWYDNIQRSLLASGALKKLIDDGVRGVTSNPTIFEKAIVGSGDYNDAIVEARKHAKAVYDVYETIAVDDIGRAADLLLPVYESSDGQDGFVSIEVTPSVSDDVAGTVAEAHKLHKRLNRRNVMIKVPSTEAGIKALFELTKAGICVNMTLIFGLDMYEKVIDAYLDGLEARVKDGESIAEIASVASFFVSRVDSLVDKWIEQKGLAEDLQGRAAVANAKLAYELFSKKFETERFAALQAKGGHVQRPLWASTSTKNPRYPDLLYVTSLVGPNTVNTMPPATVAAVLDHGSFGRTIDSNLEAEKALVAELERHGISLLEAGQQLLKEGLHSFGQSFEQLLAGLEKKMSELEA